MTRPATTDTDAPRGPRRILLHGGPGTGKTPLALSLPWGPVWGEKAVLIAADRKELSLPCERDRYIVTEYDKAADPYSFVKSVLAFDWRSEGAGTIVLDTGTGLAADYLAAAVRSGGYNSKAVTFGTETIKLSDKPHFGLAHNLMKLTIEAIKKCPLNVIAVFLSDYQEPEEGGVGAFGGPTGPNMTFSKQIAGEFSNILFTRTVTVEGKAQYLCHTENCGIWVARLGGVLPNPIPQIRMETNPVNVWQEIDRVQLGKGQ